MLVLWLLQFLLPGAFCAWGEWDAVTCYTCGLENVDPDSDQEFSYGIDPGEGKKMYNHSCDLMDKKTGQELAPRNWVNTIPLTKQVVVAGNLFTKIIPPVKDENDTVLEEGSNVTTCMPIVYPDQGVDTYYLIQEEEPRVSIKKDGVEVFREVTEDDLPLLTGHDCNFTMTKNYSRTEKKPPKDYDMTMWERKCPKGIRSCFKAKGNFDGQQPVFRGCATAKYKHGTTCKREMQTVVVTLGRPSVDVEVYMCYCSADKCNQDISGAERAGLGIIAFAALVLHALVLHRL